MSVQLFGFYFSANADKSANDRAVWVTPNESGTWTLTASYKGCHERQESASLFTLELDAEDMRRLGQLLIAFSEAMTGEAAGRGGK